MLTFLIIVHVIVCIALVAIILLQGGKGADLASVFGGGTSGTAFGVTGGATFISKLTTGVAVGFLVMSIVLAYVYTPAGAKSIMQNVAPTQGQETKPEAQPPAEAAASGGTLATEGLAPAGEEELGIASEGTEEPLESGQ